MTGPARPRARDYMCNFTELLLSQNFCNRALMRFISFASNIGTAAAVPAGPALAPLQVSKYPVHNDIFGLFRGQIYTMEQKGNLVVTLVYMNFFNVPCIFLVQSEVSLSQ